MAEINVETLLTDIKDTVSQYEDVTGIVLQATPDEEGHVDTLGMILTFDTVESPSLYGAFDVFDLTMDGVQAIFDAVQVEFATMDVNMIIG